ncbi:MAG: Hpt domain-containing protein [Desulfobacteraceae bacterium]|nr:Hpt domain-containing protein [Desulfobacteraceae bacterium]
MSEYSVNILDTDALKNTVDNNSDLVKELIRLYLGNLPKLMERIQEGIIRKDNRLIEESAHALKGMSFNISAKKTADTALSLRKIGRNNESEKAGEVYALLEKNVEELRQALDHLVNIESA